MDHEVRGPEGTKITSEASEDIGRHDGHLPPRAGQTCCEWSSTWPTAGRRAGRCRRCTTRSGPRSPPPRYTGWDGLLAEQREFLDEFWDGADVEIDGDAELQQAVRFALFHVLQAGARAERRAIAAKGLTGPGYDGHTFWDTETFCLPVLTHLQPDAAADALRWRQSILPLARERAEQLGLAGAAFPWRTIRGQECSGYWPAGTAAFHINADIADAVRRHVRSPATPTSSARSALELLVATARLWRSLGHHDSTGEFRIDGVTGPDEYTAIVDNNVYTNLMAQRNLRYAAEAAARHSRAAARLGRQRRGDGELARRREVDAHPVRRGARRAPAERGLHPPRGVGLREHPGRAVPAAAATTRTSTSTASRSSSRPTWCSRCSCGPTRSPPSRWRATSPTTRR